MFKHRRPRGPGRDKGKPVGCGLRDHHTVSLPKVEPSSAPGQGRGASTLGASPSLGVGISMVEKRREKSGQPVSEPLTNVFRFSYAQLHLRETDTTGQSGSGYLFFFFFLKTSLHMTCLCTQMKDH